MRAAQPGDEGRVERTAGVFDPAPMLLDDHPHRLCVVLLGSDEPPVVAVGELPPTDVALDGLLGICDRGSVLPGEHAGEHLVERRLLLLLVTHGSDGGLQQREHPQVRTSPQARAQEALHTLDVGEVDGEDEARTLAGSSS